MKQRLEADMLLVSLVGMVYQYFLFYVILLSMLWSAVDEHLDWFIRADFPKISDALILIGAAVVYLILFLNTKRIQDWYWNRGSVFLAWTSLVVVALIVLFCAMLVFVSMYIMPLCFVFSMWYDMTLDHPCVKALLDEE